MIYLHIGFHKAGSTTLQHFLRDNADRLAAAGRAYPAVGRRPQDIAHHRLAAILKGQHGGPAEAAALWDQIRAVADGRGSAVISSEGFERADPAVLAALLADLPVKVIVYIRDLPSRVVSIYTQSTKTGFNTLDFDAFFEREIKRVRTPAARKLKPWGKAFGRSNIRVRSLDRAVLAGGDLITDFLNAIDLEEGAEGALRLERPGDQNVSPGWRAVEVARYLNQNPDWIDANEAGMAADDSRSVRGMLLKAADGAEAVLGLRDRGVYLTPEQARVAADIHNADMDRLEVAARMDVRVTRAAGEAPPRPFLPDWRAMPAVEQADIFREMVRSLAVQTMERPWRRTLAARGEDDSVPSDEERAERRRQRKLREAGGGEA